MRVFLLGLAVAAILAIVASNGLNLVQQTSSQAYSTDATRLDHQESVNNFGREG